MDGAAAGNLPAAGLANGQAGSNGNPVTVPTSQPSLAGWGMGGNAVSLGEGGGQQAGGQQQWAAHSRGHSLRDASGATIWPAWPANNGELSAENKVRPSCMLSSGTSLATLQQLPTNAARLASQETGL